MNQVGLYSKVPHKPYSFIGNVNETDFKLIRNRIIGHSFGGTKEIVTSILQKAGWDEDRDQRNIFVPVIEAFMQAHDLNLTKLRRFHNNKQDYWNLSKRLQERKPFSIYHMLDEMGLLPGVELKKLVDQLWSITTCVNQVGVGPGEICLTALTNARKGARGDLILTNIGDVEVKSSYGRIGSGDNALQVPERFQMLFDSRSLSIAKVRAHIQEVTQKKAKDRNWTWNEAVQSFFLYDWGFSEPTITRSFAYLSPQHLDFSQHSSLLKGVRRIYAAHPIREKLLNRDRDELVRMVLSVQLSCYHAVHQFPYMLCVNKETKEACPLHFSSRKSVEENFVSIYNQILKINRFSSNLSIDSEGTRKGVEINFK